ncbi:MAG: metal ABC transporter permease, partial [Acetobacteraceae bacterium]
ALVLASVAIALVATVVGLLLSFHADVPAGPAIVLSAGALWAGSLVAGPQGSLLVRLRRRPHLAR